MRTSGTSPLGHRLGMVWYGMVWSVSVKYRVQFRQLQPELFQTLKSEKAMWMSMKLGLKQGDYWKCKRVTVWTGFGSLTSEGEKGVPRALCSASLLLNVGS